MDVRRYLRCSALSGLAAGLFLTASLLSRDAVIAAGDLRSFVWPAAGVGVVWLLARNGLVNWLVDLPLLCLAEGVVAVYADVPGRLVPVVAGSAVLGTVATTTVMRRLEPSLTDAATAPLRTPRAVVRFVVGAVVGCALGVGVGALGMLVVTGSLSPTAVVLGWGRNVCAVLAVGVPGLLLVDHLRTRPRPRLLPGVSRVELLFVLAVTSALVAADRLSDLPLSFLLPAVTVWTASRFPPLVVAVHVLLGGSATIWLTTHGHGPFAEVDPLQTAALLSQVFVATTLLMGLLLAASRERNRALEAERIERAREQREDLLGFARRAAHDLQGPLAVIEGWSTELADTVGRDPFAISGEVTAMVTRIRDAAGQARSLVNDILTDAAAHDREPVRERVNLTELARQAAAAHAGVADVVVLEIGVARGDAPLLRQLFANLLDNAVKYVRPGETPRITVGGDLVGSELVVWVADLGVGIPPGQHQRIFDEFERASDDHPGTGIGLSICRRIVERHGGRIRALDRDDGRSGAVFELTLPAWGAQRTSYAHPATAHRTNHRTKVTT